MKNEEIVEMIQAGQGDRNELLTALYQQNLPIIRKVCSRYEERAEMEDLLQQAFISLTRAVEMFDAEKGFKFASYFTWYIQQGCVAVVNSMSPVYYPRNYRTELNRYVRVATDLTKTLGRVPEPSEVAEVLGVSSEKIQQYDKDLMKSNCRSFSEVIDEEGELTLEDVIPSGSDLEQEAVDSCAEKEVSKLLTTMVAQLGEDQQNAIREYFGKNMDLETMAKKHGTTKAEQTSAVRKGLNDLRKQRANCNKLRALACLDETAYDWGLRSVSVNSFNNTHESSTEKAAFKLDEVRKSLKAYLKPGTELYTSVSEAFRRIHGETF